MNDTLTEILEELDIFEGEEVELSQTNTTKNKLLNWGFRWQKHNKLKEVSKMTDKKLTQGELENKVYDYVDSLDSAEIKELLIDLL